jgi:hypothetical protein
MNLKVLGFEGILIFFVLWIIPSSGGKSNFIPNFERYFVETQVELFELDA